MDEAIKKLLTRGGAKLGLALTEAQIEHFITYLTELKRWNRKAHLVGVRPDGQQYVSGTGYVELPAAMLQDAQSQLESSNQSQ